MGHSKILISETAFFYRFFRNSILIFIPVLLLATIILSLPYSSATSGDNSGSGSGTDTLTISISSACTLSSVVDSEHIASVNAGTYTSDIGRTTITTLCNDGNGYSVYAVGYSNNEEGNNRLINSSYPQYSIDTGLATSGLTSTWAMKLNNIEHDPSPTPPTIESDYNNAYGIIPPYWTKVAGRSSGTTDMNEGSSFTTTYAVYAASSQYVGTYLGQVKYLLTHPNSNDTTINDIDAAFWLAGKQKVYSDENGSYFAMQDMTSDICNSVSQNGKRTTTQLVDIRDNKLYYVTKLKDGHCWMTENLNVDINSSISFNSNNTDLNVAYDSSTGQYMEYSNGYTESNGVIYWTPASSATTIDFTGTTVTGWRNSNTTPYTANKTDDTETGHASLGNYYNWTAAIASNNSSSLTQDTLSNIANNPKNSICPKWWRLPTISNQSETLSGSTNEFARLNYLYNDNLTNTDAGLITVPIWLMRYGRASGGTIVNFNIYGYYTSSTIYSSGGIYYANFTNNNIDLIAYYDDSKVHGYSVRCVAR